MQHTPIVQQIEDVRARREHLVSFLVFQAPSRIEGVERVKREIVMAVNIMAVRCKIIGDGRYLCSLLTYYLRTMTRRARCTLGLLNTILQTFYRGNRKQVSRRPQHRPAEYHMFANRNVDTRFNTWEKKKWIRSIRNSRRCKRNV